MRELNAHWIAREVAEYREGTASQEALIRALSEVGQQARNVFAIHVTVCAYVIVTLLSVKDSGVFWRRGWYQATRPRRPVSAHALLRFDADPAALGQRLLAPLCWPNAPAEAAPKPKSS